MNEDIHNIIATIYFGKSSDYLPIIRHFRLNLAQTDYVKLLERDKSKRQTLTLAGKEWDVVKSEGAVLSRE